MAVAFPAQIPPVSCGCSAQEDTASPQHSHELR